MTHEEFAEYDEDGNGTIVDDFDAGTEDVDDAYTGADSDTDEAIEADADVDLETGTGLALKTDEDEFAEEGEDDMDDAAKARLAAALAGIDARFGRPPSEQVGAFAEAHQTLQATLNRIDTP